MKKLKTILSVILVAIFFITACGTELYTDGNADGYTLVRDVDGVSFGVVSSVVRNATAITSISESMNFEKDQTYLYKNGESEYLMFNISSLVLAVQKGTSFNLSEAEDKTEVVISNNVMGIWFDLPKDKLEYDDNTADGVYKFMATVNGEVSITSELYEDFAGKLVVINDGTEEWSLFVGSKGTDFSSFDDDMQETINYMAASLQKAVDTAVEEEAAVNIGGSEASVDEIESTDVSSNSSEDVSIEEVEKTNDNADSQTTADAESSATEDISIAEVEDEVEIIEETEPTSETDENNDSESAVLASSEAYNEVNSEVIEDESTVENSTEETYVEENIEVSDEDETSSENESESALEERGLSIVLNNQKNTQKDDTTIYESSIYDMLRLSKWGYFDVKNGKTIETISAKISDLKTGEEAVEIIKNAIAASDVPYEYFAPRTGTSWHVVKVTEGENSTSGLYIDVKIVGADGNALNYRGIKYSSRTYNIAISDTEKYVYYEVPNGCAEYVLTCGDGTVDSEILSNSYYLIQKGTDY